MKNLTTIHIDEYTTEDLYFLQSQWELDIQDNMEWTDEMISMTNNLIEQDEAKEAQIKGKTKMKNSKEIMAVFTYKDIDFTVEIDDTFNRKHLFKVIDAFKSHHDKDGIYIVELDDLVSEKGLDYSIDDMTITIKVKNAKDFDKIYHINFKEVIPAKKTKAERFDELLAQGYDEEDIWDMGFMKREDVYELEETSECVEDESTLTFDDTKDVDIQEQALKAEMLKKSDIDIDAVVTDTDSYALTNEFIDVCKIIKDELDELESITDTDEACEIVSVDLVKDEIRSASCILENILFKIKVHNNSFDSKGYVLPDFTISGVLQERLDMLCEKLDVNISDIRKYYTSRIYKDERPIKMDSKRGSTGCFMLVVIIVAALTLLATMCDSGAITKDEQEQVGDAVTEQAQKVKAVIDDNEYRVDRFKNYINKLSGE